MDTGTREKGRKRLILLPKQDTNCLGEIICEPGLEGYCCGYLFLLQITTLKPTGYKYPADFAPDFVGRNSGRAQEDRSSPTHVVSTEAGGAEAVTSKLLPHLSAPFLSFLGLSLSLSCIFSFRAPPGAWASQ